MGLAATASPVLAETEQLRQALLARDSEADELRRSLHSRSLETDQLHTTLHARNLEVAALHKDLHASRTQLAAIESSRTWRWTRPLRALVDGGARTPRRDGRS